MESTTCPPFTVCVQQSRCWDADNASSNTAACFVLSFAMISIGLFFVIFGELCLFTRVKKEMNRWMKNIKSRKTKSDVASDQPKSNMASDQPKSNVASDQMPLRRTLVSFQLESARCIESEVLLKELDDEIKQTLSDPAFITTRRTELNFVKDNNDPTVRLPEEYASEYSPLSNFPASGFLFQGFMTVIKTSVLFSNCWLSCFGWSLFCSGISTVFWNMINYEGTCSTETIFQDWIREVANSFDTISTDFVFYPVFLIVGYLTFILSRWREFMINAHSIQGRLQDVALLCGSAVSASPGLEVRKRLFVIYRYLNLIHAVCYKSVSPTLEGLDLETEFVGELGLLKDEEVIQLMATGNKIRDTVIAWLGAEVSALLLMEGVNNQFVEVDLANSLRGVRRSTAKHHDLFVRDNPNLYTGCLVLVVNFFLFLILVSYPFSLLVYSVDSVACFQPIVMIGVFVLVASYQTAYCLLYRLRDPFSWNKDRIQVDSLMAGTERATFALLRAMFGPDQSNSVQMKAEDGEARTARLLLSSPGRPSLRKSYLAGSSLVKRPQYWGVSYRSARSIHE